MKGSNKAVRTRAGKIALARLSRLVLELHEKTTGVVEEEEKEEEEHKQTNKKQTDRQTNRQTDK